MCVFIYLFFCKFWKEWEFVMWKWQYAKEVIKTIPGFKIECDEF